MESRAIHSAGNLKVHTPSDTLGFDTDVCRGILLEEDGAVKILTVAGDEVTIPNLAGGMIHPIQAQKVFATGTDATSVILVF